MSATKLADGAATGPDQITATLAKCWDELLGMTKPGVERFELQAVAERFNTLAARAPFAGHGAHNAIHGALRCAISAVSGGMS